MLGLVAAALHIAMDRQRVLAVVSDGPLGISEGAVRHRASPVGRARLPRSALHFTGDDQRRVKGLDGLLVLTQADVAF